MATPFNWSVSAAVAVFDGDDRVLLQQRRDNGAWELPGGCVELGETPWSAARRECIEETGTRPRDLTLSGCYTRCDVPVTEFVFAARAYTGTPQATEESTDVKFVPIEDAAGMLGQVFARKMYAALNTEPGGATPIDYARHDNARWL